MGKRKADAAPAARKRRRLAEVSCPCGGEWQSSSSGPSAWRCSWTAPHCPFRAVGMWPAASRLLCGTCGQAVCRSCAAQQRPVLHIVHASRVSGNVRPACCDLCADDFRRQLAAAAKRAGIQTVHHRVGSVNAWRSLLAKQGRGRMEHGAAAVFLHAGATGEMHRECLPADVFYEGLSSIAARQQLLYPAAPSLDRLHSDKAYVSKHMPPTAVVRLTRAGGLWSASIERVVGGAAPVVHGQQIGRCVAAAARMVTAAAAEAGLPAGLMVKQGWSWAARDVIRAEPTAAAATAAVTELAAKIPEAISSVCVLIQARVEVLAELRWVVLDGEPRGYNLRARAGGGGSGRLPADYNVTDRQCRENLRSAGVDADSAIRSLRGTVMEVVEEAAADNLGTVPQFLRVDLLITHGGKAYLCERESWGADLVETKDGSRDRTNPTRSQLAAAMVARVTRRFGT